MRRGERCAAALMRFSVRERLSTLALVIVAEWRKDDGIRQTGGLARLVGIVFENVLDDRSSFFSIIASLGDDPFAFMRATFYGRHSE